MLTADCHNRSNWHSRIAVTTRPGVEQKSYCTCTSDIICRCSEPTNLPPGRANTSNRTSCREVDRSEARSNPLETIEHNHITVSIRLRKQHISAKPRHLHSVSFTRHTLTLSLFFSLSLSLSVPLMYAYTCVYIYKLYIGCAARLAFGLRVMCLNPCSLQPSLGGPPAPSTSESSTR